MSNTTPLAQMLVIAEECLANSEHMRDQHAQMADGWRHECIRLRGLLQEVKPRTVRKKRPQVGWTTRQWEVLDALVMGEGRRELAARLGITSAGVKAHLRVMRARVGADSADELYDLMRQRYPLRYGVPYATKEVKE